MTMKSLTSTAIVALTAGLMGLGAAAPAATAQQAPMQPNAGMTQPGQPGMHMPRQGRNFHFRQGRANLRMGDHMGRGRRGGALLDLVCSPRGAERLEVALVRLSYRVELTAEQQPLYDDLRTAALTAQTQFADACDAARPQPSASATPAPADPVAALRSRLDLEKAHTAALESVLPKFEAFWNSLSEEQKAQLQPQRGKGRVRQGRGMMQPPQPGQPAQPAQPAPTQPSQPAQPAPANPAPATPGNTING
jgi:hypothetical protein